MRILFVTQWFDPEPGAVRGLPLARWLRDRGHDVQVLTGFPNYPGGSLYPGYQLKAWQRERMEGIDVLRVPLYPSHDGSVLRRVANYGTFATSAASIGASLSRSADVAYVYHPPATIGLPALVLKALRGIPYVYHIADMWPESVVESGMLRNETLKSVVGSSLAAWCRLAYRQAAGVSVLSPGFKRLLVERGVAADKIKVIYNWADEATFKPTPRDVALEDSLGLRGCFNVVYAGNMGAFQGLETVIRAAARLRANPALKVVMVGTGQKEQELQALSKELGADNVVFLGRRQYWEMGGIYSVADVLVVHLKDLPFFADTIPSKTQVSLACGRPVLMAVRGDAADIVRRARAGVVVDPEDDRAMADGIMQLYRLPPDERERLGQNGRDYYLEEMSLERGAARTEELLGRVARHAA